MRPQHITAENALQVTYPDMARTCFNEAAAYHCGKRRTDATGAARSTPASMRPQHITAENGNTPEWNRIAGWCFNEAAAY